MVCHHLFISFIFVVGRLKVARPPMIWRGGLGVFRSEDAFPAFWNIICCQLVDVYEKVVYISIWTSYLNYKPFQLPSPKLQPSSSAFCTSSGTSDRSGGNCSEKAEKSSGSSKTSAQVFLSFPCNETSFGVFERSDLPVGMDQNMSKTPWIHRSYIDTSSRNWNRFYTAFFGGIRLIYVNLPQPYNQRLIYPQRANPPQKNPPRHPSVNFNGLPLISQANLKKGHVFHNQPNGFRVNRTQDTTEMGHGIKCQNKSITYRTYRTWGWFATGALTKNHSTNVDETVTPHFSTSAYPNQLGHQHQQ